MLTVSICGAAHSGQHLLELLGANREKKVGHERSAHRARHFRQDQFSSFVNDRPARISAAILATVALPVPTSRAVFGMPVPAALGS